MDMPRIARVQALDGSRLRVTWRSGDDVVIDLTGWIASGGALLAPLRVATVFATAATDEYGADVIWVGPGNLAIDALHLARIADAQRPFGANEAAAWQKTIGLSNREVADLLDVVPSTWSAYKAGTSRVPVTVAIACRASAADPVLLHALFRPARPAGRPPVRRAY